MTAKRLVRVDSLTPEQIQSCLASYPSALLHKAGDTLQDLDDWYQSLPLLSASPSAQGGGLTTKQDLIKLMRWKLCREKHRPTLLALISSNSESLCSDVLSRASAYIKSATQKLDLISSPPEDLLNAVNGAMKILTELRGVGPATSSAIVVAWTEYGIFQSDELVHNLLSTTENHNNTKIVYSMPFYRKFYIDAITALKRLHLRADVVGGGREMERIAWAMCNAPSSPLHTAAGKGAKEAAKTSSSPEALQKGQGQNAQAEKESKRTTKRKVDAAKNEAQHAETRRASKRIRTKT